jgi:hypothetical protein
MFWLCSAKATLKDHSDMHELRADLCAAAMHLFRACGTRLVVVAMLSMLMIDCGLYILNISGQTGPPLHDALYRSTCPCD